MDDRLFHRRNSGFQRRAPPESGQRLSRSGMCEEELFGRDVQRFETPVDVIEFGPQIITHLWGKLEDEEDAAVLQRRSRRSGELRVGKECGSTCGLRWSPYPEKENRQQPLIIGLCAMNNRVNTRN